MFGAWCGGVPGEATMFEVLILFLAVVFFAMCELMIRGFGRLRRGPR